MRELEQPSITDEQPIAADHFESYFSSTDDPLLPPKVLITTSPKATKATYRFCDELVGVFPGGEFIRRKKGKKFELGRISGWAANRGYKHLCVVNEDTKTPSFVFSFTVYLAGIYGLVSLDAITLVHLPNGPTAYFRLTSVELTERLFVSFHLDVCDLAPIGFRRDILGPPLIIPNLFLTIL